jgi:hypothetical protein
MLQLEGVRRGGDGEMSSIPMGLNDRVFQFRVGEKRSKGMDVVRMSADVKYQKLGEHTNKAG